MRTDTEAETLRRDIFPAEVYVPYLGRGPMLARVFVTDRRVIVWTAEPAAPLPGWKSPVRLVDEPVVGDLPARDRGSFFGQLRVDTASGPVHVTKAGGCGCGSPLKALSAPVGW
jgi:hypothetical protein